MEPDNLWLLLSIIRQPFDNVRFWLLLHSWIEIEYCFLKWSATRLQSTCLDANCLARMPLQVSMCACVSVRASHNTFLWIGVHQLEALLNEVAQASCCMWRQWIVLNKFSVRFVIFTIQFIRSHSRSRGLTKAYRRHVYSSPSNYSAGVSFDWWLERRKRAFWTGRKWHVGWIGAGLFGEWGS